MMNNIDKTYICDCDASKNDASATMIDFSTYTCINHDQKNPDICTDNKYEEK